MGKRIKNLYIYLLSGLYYGDKNSNTYFNGTLDEEEIIDALNLFITFNIKLKNTKLSEILC